MRRIVKVSAAEADRQHSAASISAWRRRDPAMEQEFVASQLGRSMSTVQRWERGLSEPKVSDILAMERMRRGLVAQLFRTSLRGGRA